jgi:hypothetical protein
MVFALHRPKIIPQTSFLGGVAGMLGKWLIQYLKSTFLKR